MKILHMSRSITANAPIHTNNFLNKYSEGKVENRCIVAVKKGMEDTQDITWEWEDKIIIEKIPQFEEFLQWCDIIHIHNQPPFMNGSKGWKLLENIKKPIILQVHSEPEKLKVIYEVLLKHFPIAAILVIAQYHAIHMFTDKFHVVRNPIDLNDIDLQPVYLNNKIPHVTFAPSNITEKDRLLAKWNSTWAYKSYYEVKPILEKLTKENVITHQIFNGVNFRESLSLRKKGDIHIDDIYTGSYHLSSLEGMAQGKAVICNLKPWMIGFLYKFLNQDAILPWIIADEDSLESKLRYYSKHRNKLIELQHRSRKWVEENWDSKSVCEDYLKVYNSL